jgi:GMP synthase-like glutamine amidotransferase
MVGICFGHQIIAQALGGKVEKFDGGWSVGPTAYEFDGDSITLNAWHQDQITRLPEGAEVIATSPFCRYAALAYDDRAFTLQAHPEFDSPFAKDLIEARGRGVVPDPLLDAAQTRLRSTQIDDTKLARQIADFFKKPRR